MGGLGLAGGFGGGRELVTPASNSVGQAFTTASLVDITSLTVTVDVGSRPVYVWYQLLVAIGKGTAATGDRGVVAIALLEDGVEVDRIALASGVPASSNVIMPAHRVVRRTPTPGTHTYKLQGMLGATGTYSGSVLTDTGTGADSPLLLGCREA